MAQAAAEGVIDFTQAIPSDTWWWTKVSLLIKTLESKNKRELLKLYIRASLSQLANARISQAGHDELAEGVNADIMAIRKLLQPWVKELSPEDIAAEASNMWQEMYGDLDDPETKDLIAKALEALRN